MPYNGEFHFTALRTLGTFRTMSASRRFPRSRFQPGMAAMYACTGASPSAFAICGLPPARRVTFADFLDVLLAIVFERMYILFAKGRGEPPPYVFAKSVGHAERLEEEAVEEAWRTEQRLHVQFALFEVVERARRRAEEWVGDVDAGEEAGERGRVPIGTIGSMCVNLVLVSPAWQPLQVPRET